MTSATGNRTRPPWVAAIGHPLFFAILAPLIACLTWPFPGMHLPAALTVIALGTVHGALDVVHLTSSRLPAGVAVTGYAALAAGAGLFWLAFPVAALILLLLLSVAHFGTSDTGTEADLPWLEASIRGAAVVTVPAGLNESGVASLLAAVVPLATADTVAAALATAAPLSAGAALLLALSISGSRPATAFELAALLLVFAVTPPLLGFALYFTLLHGARHCASVDLNLLSRRHWLMIGASTLAALAGATLLGSAAGDAAIGAVFAGLFALTVPHTALHALLEALGRGRPSESARCSPHLTRPSRRPAHLSQT